MNENGSRPYNASGRFPAPAGRGGVGQLFLAPSSAPVSGLARWAARAGACRTGQERQDEMAHIIPGLDQLHLFHGLHDPTQSVRHLRAMRILRGTPEPLEFDVLLCTLEERGDVLRLLAAATMRTVERQGAAEYTVEHLV